jgi:hypothetical protein
MGYVVYLPSLCARARGEISGAVIHEGGKVEALKEMLEAEQMEPVEAAAVARADDSFSLISLPWLMV